MTPRSPRQPLRAIVSIGFITAISLTLYITFVANKQAQSQTFSPPQNLLAVTNQKRVALVIGNSNYQAPISLANPVNDAEDIAKTLGELGFEVIKVIDGNQKQMDAALERFSAKLTQGTVGVFYYAGHGVQVNGENYLIPINAQLAAEKDVVYETLPVGKVQNAMDKRGTTSIIILDACRNNPFSRRWYRGTNTRGLAPIEAFTSSYIAFSTAPGTVAADGEGRNGTFTFYLLKHLKTPNLPIENLFKKVRNEVLKATFGSQKPWDSSSLTDEFFFNPVSTARDTPPTTIPKPIIPPTPPVAVPKPVTPPTTPPPVVATANRPQDFISKLIPYPLDKISLAYTFKGVGFRGISADGQTLVTGNDKVVEIWNLTTKKLIRTLPIKYSYAYKMALSSDGRVLANYSSNIDIWDIRTGKMLYSFAPPKAQFLGIIGSAYLLSITISPNGKTLATSWGDGTIRTWNITTGKPIRTISGKCGRIRSVIINYDDKTLINGCDNKTIQVWNLTTGKLENTLTGHTQEVQSVAISSDGKTLVSSDVKTIKIWNLSTGTLIDTITDNPGWSVAISPDMKTIISIGREVKLWDLNTRKLISSLPEQYRGLRIIAVSAVQKTVVIESEVKFNSNSNIDVWKAL